MYPPTTPTQNERDPERAYQEEEVAIKVSLDAKHGQHEKTFLHSAAESGDVELIDSLIQYGAILTAKDVQGWTPLCTAVFYNQIKAVKALHKHGAKINETPNQDSNYLIDAIYRNQTQMAMTLIELGAIAHHKLSNGTTALHVAASMGQTQLIRVLLQNNADISAIDAHGDTPLTMAVRRGHQDTIEFLLARGALDDEAIVPESLITIAFENGHHHIVALLQNHGVQFPAYIQEAHRYFEQFFMGLLRPQRNLHTPAALQTTHGVAIHKSAAESAERLKRTYAAKDLAAAKDQLLNWAEGLKPQNDNPADPTKATKDCLDRIKTIQFTEARSNVTLQEVLGLIWLVANDEKEIKKDLKDTSDEKIAEEKNARLRSLIPFFYEAHRNYNLDESNKDLGGESRPACVNGTFNKLISSLDKKHPDVIVHYVTYETIIWKTQTCLSESFGVLTEDAKKAYIEEMQATDPTKSTPVVEIVKQMVSEALHKEFDPYRHEVPDYDNLIKILIDSIASMPNKTIEDWTKKQASAQKLSENADGSVPISYKKYTPMKDGQPPDQDAKSDTSHESKTRTTPH